MKKSGQQWPLFCGLSVVSGPLSVPLLVNVNVPKKLSALNPDPGYGY
jgi:hypothetical protein